MGSLTMASLSVATRPRPFGLPVHTGVAVIVATGLACALVAFAVSMGGWKIAVGAVGAAALALCLALVSHRPTFVLVLLVLSTQVVFRKTFGPLQSEFSGGGPPGVYVSSIDLVLVLLYAFWLSDGTLWRDVRRNISRPIFLVPLLGGLTVLPSIFAAVDAWLWAGEFTRLLVQYLLFLYVALRVRTRRDIMWVLAGLAIVAAAQFVLVVLQARAGTTLGLDALGAGGTQTGTLAPRTIDGGDEIPRPSGTIVHAILLAAFMASIGSVALNLALHLRAPLHRLFWLAITGITVGSVVITMGRAPALGLAVSLPLSVLYALMRRRLSWRLLGLAILVGGLGSIPAWGKFAEIVTNNIGTDHFWLEVQARLQLNDVAVNMLNTSPLIGVGLNNAARLLDEFEPYGVIFPSFPAHNIYLLVASETGIIGLFGLLAMIGAPLVPAWRLARSGDRFLSAVGCGIAAALLTVYVQELLVLALRYDVPRTVFWLLSGLAVAGWRMLQRERRQAAAPVAARRHAPA